MLKLYRCARTGLDFVEAGDDRRLLGSLLPQARHIETLMRLPRASTVFPQIDPAQWKNIDRQSGFWPDGFILDQNGVGGCVGWSEANAEMRGRYVRFGENVILSGAYAYAQINGGRDNGAVITDSMTAGQEKGICLKSTMDLPHIYLPQVPSGADQEALKYRIGAAAVIMDEKDLALSIQFETFPQFAIMVGNNFNDYDSEGVSGFTPGPGNHSVHADSMVYSTKTGRWIIKIPNTWGKNNGPNKDGYNYVTFQHFNGPGSMQNAYVHLSPLANDVDNPPAPK